MNELLIKVEKTLRYHGEQLQRSLRHMRWNINRPEIDPPVFVVGCSRAGTTLVYKTFSESPVLGTLQRETHDFWMDLHPLSERNWDTHALSGSDVRDGEGDYIKKYFYGLIGNQRFVDKNNQNGLCIPYLYALFPDAYFVYVKRSPGDNINSLIEGWGKPEEFATWSNELPKSVSIDDGKYKKWCFFLMDGWRELTSSSVEEVSAQQYISINNAIMDGRSIVPKDHWVDICYEDLLKDPVKGFEEAFIGIGLDFTPQLKSHCENVLSTPYNAFSEIRLDKWRDGRNKEKIERILPSVNEVAKRMGYGI